MEKIHKNMCKQACYFVFIQENYIKAHVLMYFLKLVFTFTPHYIIMVKGLLGIAWPNYVSVCASQGHSRYVMYKYGMWGSSYPR